MNGVLHIGITVANLEKSLQFYRDTLQLPFRGQLTMQGAASDRLFGVQGAVARIAYVATGEAPGAPCLELIDFSGVPVQKVPAQLFKTAITEVCLKTSDLRSDFKRLQQQGVEFLSEPEEFDFTADGFGRSLAVYLRDPDGTILELMQNL